MVLLVSIFCIIFMLFISVGGHVPDYYTTPANKVEQHCLMAENCYHDTIPVCGVLENEKRSFLDLCDLLEYACDTSRIYSHIDDIPNCPIHPHPSARRSHQKH